MSWALIAGCLWVVASTVVAMLPMRAQMVPGVALLVAAPALLVWIATQHGVWLTLIGTLAFLSMFRNPLRYFVNRALGRPTELPPELKDRLK